MRTARGSYMMTILDHSFILKPEVTAQYQVSSFQRSMSSRYNAGTGFISMSNAAMLEQQPQKLQMVSAVKNVLAYL